MRSRIAIILLAFMMLPTVSPQEAEHEPSARLHDRDNDRIDDRLERHGNKKQEIAVLLDGPLDRTTARDLRGAGLKIEYESTHINAVVGNARADQLEKIGSVGAVSFIEASLTFSVHNDLARQGSKISETGLYPDDVWNDLGFSGSGVVVAVLDTGVDEAHECLSGKFLGGFSAFSTSFVNPIDEHGHGTHVACTAVGHGGSPMAPYGVNAGAAPGARLVDVQVLDGSGDGTLLTVLAGIDWAIDNRATDWGVPGFHGIDIINLSLGSDSGSDGSDALSLAINAAADAGIIPIVAAGNEGTSGSISSPGAADKAITVGATNQFNTVSRADDAVPSFSNCGPREDDGDGDSLDEQKPVVVAPGVNIMSAAHGTGNGYFESSGTSMATPHVAGTVALLLEMNPGLTWEDVHSLLTTSSEDIGPAGWDGCSGHGILDARALLTTSPTTMVADFDRAPATAESLESITFTDTSIPGPTAISQWTWDFGDGTTLVRVSDGTPGTVSHAFATSGTYTVTLDIENLGGDTAQTSAQITILNQAPLASFTVDQSWMVGEPNTFTSTSMDADGTIASWEWDFGDGNVDTIANPTHAYAVPATYTVTLTVTDDLGAQASTVAQVAAFDVLDTSFHGRFVRLTPPITSGDTPADGSFAWTVRALSGGPVLAQGSDTASAGESEVLIATNAQFQIGSTYRFTISGTVMDRVHYAFDVVPISPTWVDLQAETGKRLQVSGSLVAPSGDPITREAVTITARDAGGEELARQRVRTDSEGVADARFSGAAASAVRFDFEYLGSDFGGYLSATSLDNVL